MSSIWGSKLGKLAKTVVENLPKAGEAGAAALAGIPLKKSSVVTFKDFIRRISLCESQDEIEAMIRAELESLDQLLALPTAECTARAQALSVAVYCHLLGYDVGFIRIHAITLAQQGSLLQKRMGYLAVSLLVRPTDELAVLLINTVLGDLRSTHVLVVCTALNMVCHLVTAENTATFMPPVLEKLKHRQPAVRDKAVRALHSLLQQAPELLPRQLEAVEAALLDRDPAVMASAVQLCLTFAALNPAPFTHLTSSLMTILGQIQSRKLPPDFDHKGVPAPWLQCSLIRLISFLCPDDSGLADTFSQFLLSQLSAGLPSTAMGFAVLCECVAAAATLPPGARPPVPPVPGEGGGGGDAPSDAGLHAAALRCAGLMVRSATANVRYAGLSALCRLCAAGAARPTGPLQLAVVQCLRDHDETVRLSALQLLHDVASPESAPAVCARLREAARAAGRPEVRALLRGRALRLAERFVWRRPALLSELAASLEEEPDGSAADAAAARLRSRLAAAQDDTSDEARQLCTRAAEFFCDMLLDDTAGKGRLRALALWTVGELSLESDRQERLVSALSARLPELAAEEPDLEPSDSDDPATPLQQHLRCLERTIWRTAGDLPADCEGALSAALRPLTDHADPAAADLARSCLALLGDRTRLRRVVDTYTALLDGRLSPDFSLSFADAWVSEALDSGAAVLQPPVPAGAAAAGSARGSAAAASDSTSPTRDPGSPFETLSPLPLPAFLAEDGPSPPTEEPPPVWTLQGRAREPAVAASQPAPRLSAEVAGEASCDADLQEAEQLFPRKDSS